MLHAIRVITIVLVSQCVCVWLCNWNTYAVNKEYNHNKYNYDL